MEMMRSPFQTQITIELRTNSFAVGGSPLGSRNNLQEFDVQIEIANKIGAGPKSPIVRVKEVPLGMLTLIFEISLFFLDVFWVTTF